MRTTIINTIIGISALAAEEGLLFSGKSMLIIDDWVLSSKKAGPPSSTLL